ncbi:AraC family transcriptional regulator [Shouchella shacheensis]|uniref:AraC family transcriptional regulator n=1 Tax=Shouchella shacheensis TaxID=1649580 RepID=UPI0009EA2502|nr:AraC family transcriptional regulator [Shouchella shacheensis]
MYILSSNGGILYRHDGLGERPWRDDGVYKCIFSLKGPSRYSTQQGDFQIGRDELLLLNPHDSHRQLSVTEEKFLIEINSDLFHSTDLTFASVTYKYPSLNQWSNFVRGYLRSQPNQDDLLNFIEHSIFQFVHLLKQYTIHSYQSSWSSVHDHALVERVIDALKQSYRNQWNLGEMASVANTSKYQFSRIFKEQTGTSPYSWLQIYRVMKSQEDLKRNVKTITSISHEYGFKNVSSYTFYFKTLYGITPSNFRSLYSNDHY